jgi:hypothetical protein
VSLLLGWRSSTEWRPAVAVVAPNNGGGGGGEEIDVRWEVDKASSNKYQNKITKQVKTTTHKAMIENFNLSLFLT